MPVTPTSYSRLQDQLTSYLSDAQVKQVYEAFLFSSQAHEGQFRKSGEPYIWHPVAVAEILAKLQMDTDSLIAALLHDVIEDTPVSKAEIAEKFGMTVAEIVDGVSKLDKLKFDCPSEAQAANFRKMMLAMAKDVRVILIKLADRLHNMRTLGVMRPDKKRRIANETLEIYSPIAARLGINAVRIELDDLSLKAKYPLRYRVLKDQVNKSKGHRKSIVDEIQATIENRLKQETIKGVVTGREKHLLSLYNKMTNKHLSFHEVLDLYAFRIHVPTVADAYLTLGAVHNLYPPLPGRFKDYIAIPKANGYQSLHTVLFGPYGVHIEVQIRTHDMHRVAEHGIAAHWSYKQGEASSPQDSDTRTQDWIKHLLDMQKSAGDSLEFLENVKVDLFPKNIFVFTPKGDILSLPKGATIVDFAYHVHTDLGNHCIGGRVNKMMVPLQYQLENGQTVEIITSANAMPNPRWLDFLQTGKARTQVRHVLKNLQDEKAIELGKRLLQSTFQRQGIAYNSLDENNIAQATIEHFHFEKLDELYYAIGTGDKLPRLITQFVKTLNHVEESDQDEEEHSNAIVLQGDEDLIVHYSNCCHPIPGDNVVGYMSAGKGLVVHRANCKHVKQFHKTQPENWVEVSWSDMNDDTKLTAAISVENINQRGVLADVASNISKLDCNIESVRSEQLNDQLNITHYIITVRDRVHLAKVLRRLNNMKAITRAYRD